MSQLFQHLDQISSRTTKPLWRNVLTKIHSNIRIYNIVLFLDAMGVEQWKRGLARVAGDAVRMVRLSLARHVTHLLQSYHLLLHEQQVQAWIQTGIYFICYLIRYQSPTDGCWTDQKIFTMNRSKPLLSTQVW